MHSNGGGLPPIDSPFDRNLGEQMHARSLKPAVSFTGQMVALSLLYLCYLTLRGLIARHLDVQQAIGRSQELSELERQLHISLERPLQTFATHVPLAIPLVNTIYIWGNLPLLVAELVWLYFRSRRSFVILRNSLILSAIPSVILYAVIPTAPPRLSPGLGLADTLGGPNHLNYLHQPAVFANHFAAIPSMHVGWALLSGLAVYLAMGNSRWRWLALMLPAAMVVTVMTTGNHQVVDWVTGCAIAAASFWIGSLWRERQERAQLSSHIDGRRLC
jgi:hypothetical protein